MTKMELIARLNQYKELLAETEELGVLIKSPDSFPKTAEVTKKKTFMRFFWPYLVAAIVLFYVVYMAAAFIALQGTIRSGDTSNAAATQLMGDTMAGFICAAIVVIVVILFGIKIAKRKRDDANREAEYMNRVSREKYNQGLANQEAIRILEADIIKAHEFEYLVPAGYRTSEKVCVIIDLINNGKAETVDEACAMF